MPDYSKAKIYKIVCNITSETYYGSTVQSLAKRVGQHREKYHKWKKGDFCYMKSFDIIDRGDYDYSLVEECPCENKEQLHSRERYYIECNECVNKYIPGRTNKEYREDNKQKIANYYSKWYIDNRNKCIDYLKEYRLKKITCECGSEITKPNLCRHLKSKKHLAWVESQD